MPNNTYNRRGMLGLTGRAIAAGVLGARIHFAADENPSNRAGVIVGETTAARVGGKILATGGNAVDAAVAAALTACVASPQNCGVGGYGGHMMIALAHGKKVIAIDFNTAAPEAAREDMFPLDERGNVRDQTNDRGWLAVGVPGTLAGLQLALDRYGTLSLRKAVAPAIQLAEAGFPIGQGMASAIRNTAGQLRKDPASARLLLRDGELPLAGQIFRNADLANLLRTLAARDAVDSFYRGDIAQQIADEFRKHGGLVTATDLASYQAREVKPLELPWGDFTVCTAPLSAGGITVLEALSILKELHLETLPSNAARTHALLEALRASWRDRLELLGDPAKAEEPVSRLLSPAYAHTVAVEIEAAVKARQPLARYGESRKQGGTVNLSCVDKHGNMVALTLTHGNSFGARVTVEGLGLILGHGMSRFEPKPGHPNSPGPGKRPLHNMCPSVVLRDGQPVLALGGAGGRKIPNAIFNVLTVFLCQGASMAKAIDAPRLHTEGNLTVTLEKKWPEQEGQYLREIGYQVQSGNSAVVSAVSYDPRTGECRSALR